MLSGGCVRKDMHHVLLSHQSSFREQLWNGHVVHHSKILEASTGATPRNSERCNMICHMLLSFARDPRIHPSCRLVTGIQPAFWPSHCAQCTVFNCCFHKRLACVWYPSQVYESYQELFLNTRALKPSGQFIYISFVVLISVWCGLLNNMLGAFVLAQWFVRTPSHTTSGCNHVSRNGDVMDLFKSGLPIIILHTYIIHVIM